MLIEARLILEIGMAQNWTLKKILKNCPFVPFVGMAFDLDIELEPFGVEEVVWVPRDEKFIIQFESLVLNGSSVNMVDEMIKSDFPEWEVEHWASGQLNRYWSERLNPDKNFNERDIRLPRKYWPTTK